MTENAMRDGKEHWHYAVSMPATHNPAVIETMTSPETTLGKAEAKAQIQPHIRQVQGRVRYDDPVTPGRIWEPADWWTHSEELMWLWLPTAPQLMFAVYPCAGDCVSSAIAFRDELADQYRQATGVAVEVQSPN